MLHTVFPEQWLKTSPHSSDNVYIGIIIHAVNNSFSFFNASVLNDKVWSMYSGNEFIQMAVGIIILIIGILMLRWEMGRGKRYG